MGAAFGPKGLAARETEKVLGKIRARLAAIQQLELASTQMVLARLCADVSALMYQLRVAGDLMDPAALEKQHIEQEHSGLWALPPHRSFVLAAQDYVGAACI